MLAYTVARLLAQLVMWQFLLEVIANLRGPMAVCLQQLLIIRYLTPSGVYGVQVRMVEAQYMPEMQH